LSLLIDTEGKVEKTDVIQNTTENKECEEIAVTAAQNISFEPAKEFGKPRKYIMLKEYGVGTLFQNPELAAGTKITEDLRRELAVKNQEAKKQASFLNPAPITRVFPIIGRKDLRVKTEGKISIGVNLTKEGTVSKLIIYDMTFKDRKYTDASIIAAFTSTYRPALQNGQPTETEFIIPYTFGLDDKEADIEPEIWSSEIKNEFIFPDTMEYRKPDFRIKDVIKAVEQLDIKEFSLFFKITKKGKVKDITPLDKEKVKKIKGLKKDAEKAIKKTKYSPAMLKNKNSDSYMLMHYNLEEVLKEHQTTISKSN